MNTYAQKLNTYPSTNSYAPQPTQPGITYTPDVVPQVTNMDSEVTYQTNAAPVFSPAYPSQTVY